MKNLLAPPSTPCLAAQQEAGAAIARALPVPASRRKDLPYAVRDLSRLLTQEREGLRRSYWSAPRLLAAYIHFFLPWNIHRLSWLLPQLDLPLADNDRVLDLGSGPLTLPLALWCARPDLRGLRLRFACVDTAQSPLEAGARIFAELAPRSPWKLELKRLRLEAALGESGFALITAGNVLNELPPPRRGSEEDRLEILARRLRAGLKPGGRVLLVEPGTRRGGRLVEALRRAALPEGFAVLAPCTHENPCPMLEQARYVPGLPQPSSWCHFTHPPRLAPARLLELSRAACMERDGLALSCLLLRTPSSEPAPPGPPGAGADDLDYLESLYREALAEDRGAPVRHEPAEPALEPVAGPQPVRVISGMIRLPGETEAARYACGPSGLCLLRDAAHTPSGGGVTADPGPEYRRDPKTGALMLARADLRPVLPAGAGERPHGKTRPRSAPPAVLAEPSDDKAKPGPPVPTGKRTRGKAEPRTAGERPRGKGASRPGHPPIGTKPPRRNK